MKINIVTIGSGWVVTNRHIPSLTKSGKCKVQAIVGRKKEKLEYVCKKYGVSEFIEGNAIENAEKWINKCDAVTIGTDPMSHYEIAKFCLQNKKHVLMEKPMSIDPKKSAKLVEIAKENQVKFAIVHNFQYSDCALQLDKAIEDGKIGEIKGIFAFQTSNPNRRLPKWYEQLKWGLFFDESPHLLYLLDKYAKGVDFLHGTVWKSTEGKQTPALVNVDFKSKLEAPVHMYLNFEARISEWYLAVMGEKGTGIIDIFRDIYTFLPDDGLHTPKDIVGTSFAAISSHIWGTGMETYKVLSKNALFGNDKIVDIYLDSIIDNKPLGAIDAEVGLKVNKLQFEIMEKSIVLN